MNRMQSVSIISNPITEDIRSKGHQSIRFLPDGFSLLVADASYKPVHLEEFIAGPDTTPGDLALECIRVLKEKELLGFEGETVIVLNHPAITLVPHPFFEEVRAAAFLRKAAPLPPGDAVQSHPLKDRDLVLVHGVSQGILDLEEQIGKEPRLIHASACLVSLADQVQASDHQRGMVLAEVQRNSLDILVIREDKVLLLNRYPLQEASECIYHILNTMKQLGFDRESIPLYLSGILHPDHEYFGLMKKYIRHVRMTPYYLEGLSKTQLMQHMILSEGSKSA
ncbi:MAG: DUF3822 family protein [Bacteroidales bacterium]